MKILKIIIFLKIKKKYYFNTFLNEKYFEKTIVIILTIPSKLPFEKAVKTALF